MGKALIISSEQELYESTAELLGPVGHSVSFAADMSRGWDDAIKDRVDAMREEAQCMNIDLHCENIDKLSIGQMTSGHCDNRRCYITRGKITVDPRGNVVGCSFFGDWIMGNVRETHLKDIWNNERHRRFMKHFKQRHMKICDHCIMGVQRNPSPVQFIRSHLLRAVGKVRR